MFKSKLVRALILVICLAIGIGVIRSVYTIQTKKGIVGERQQALFELQAKNRALQQKLAEATSSAFVEKQARDKLGLVKVGETVVILDKEKIQALAGGSVENRIQEPSWKQWWSLFF